MVIAPPRKHNDQVAVLSSDGVGGVLYPLVGTVVTWIRHVLCFYSLSSHVHSIPYF